MFSLARRKLVRDIKYTSLLVIILTVGLSSWILLPSIGEHLQSALYDYSMRIATYVTVSANGAPFDQGLPQQVLEQIRTTNGVESVYSFRANFTRFVFHNISIVNISPNGNRTVSYTNVEVGIRGAPIGPGYFPLELVSLLQGRLPRNNSPEFVSNCDGPIDPQRHSPLIINSTYTVKVAGPEFAAAMVGRNAINYLYAGVCVLWNPVFLEQKLGHANFTATFGGDPNFVIVRVHSPDNVSNVANSLEGILKSFPYYQVSYDEAALASLHDLQEQSSPLYHLMGLIGIVSATSIIFFASFLATGRRSWEGGLLVSQGWNRRRILGFVFSYYSLISIIAFLASTLVSEIVSALSAYKYWVYGARLVISTPLSEFYLLSSLPLALIISAVIALLESTRFSRTRLETALKDF